MRLIGLTGDIAAGKSTVSALLSERGAVVIDADAVYADLVAPGGTLVDALVERFGPQVRAADGSLDRPVLSRLVFGDANALKDLGSLTHPAVQAEILRRVVEHAGTDRVVVLDIPLLREKGRYGLELMVVVTAPVEERIRRMLADRAMSAADARARVDAQADLADRINNADVVIDNGGTRAELVDQVDRLWKKLTS